MKKLKVLNIHKREIDMPKIKLEEILKTLSTDNDLIWPTEKWPAMKFDSTIKVGARGGHGPIRYSVEKYKPSEIIQFRFLKPNIGIHKFEINEITTEKTEIKHTINMTTAGKGTLIWLFAIRPLHNALIQDAFDKVENNFAKTKKVSKWNFWVKFLRKQNIKRKCLKN